MAEGAPPMRGVTGTGVMGACPRAASTAPLEDGARGTAREAPGGGDAAGSEEEDGGDVSRAFGRDDGRLRDAPTPREIVPDTIDDDSPPAEAEEATARPSIT